MAERIKKDISKIFNSLGLKITIEANIKVVDFLDVTFDHNKGIHYPSRKPNNDPIYINTKSDHPRSIINHLPTGISKRVSTISHDKKLFDKAAPLYNNALKASGYNDMLSYTTPATAQQPRRNDKETSSNPNPNPNHLIHVQ